MNLRVISIMAERILANISRSPILFSVAMALFFKVLRTSLIVLLVRCTSYFLFGLRLKTRGTANCRKLTSDSGKSTHEIMNNIVHLCKKIVLNIKRIYTEHFFNDHNNTNRITSISKCQKQTCRGKQFKVNICHESHEGVKFLTST